jgi:1-acyl-sn-glycerol-3-phosphate acyltransferase
MPPLSQFKPPKPNSALIWLCLKLLPVYASTVESLSFRFLENPEFPLKFIRNKSVVIAINHGDRQDPLVVIALSKYIGESLYCLVAREVFDWYHGLLGWLFQKLGCYSVNRGVADFRSIHTTQQILAHSHKKLVVFPEAEITGDEKRVHDLNPSFIHLLLESQEHIAKSSQSIPSGSCP